MNKKCQAYRYYANYEHGDTSLCFIYTKRTGHKGDNFCGWLTTRALHDNEFEIGFVCNKCEYYFNNNVDTSYKYEKVPEDQVEKYLNLVCLI